MLAHAFLAVTERSRTPAVHQGGGDLVPLTCNEIAHLLGARTLPTTDIHHTLAWSRYRRCR